MDDPKEKRVTTETLIRLKQGDEKAFESVYWKYNPWIYNFIYSFLFDNEITEDLTQTLFLKIWEKRDWIDPERNFESYLFTIARHLVYKEAEYHLISENIVNKLDWQIPDPHSIPEQEAEVHSLQNYINELVQELPPGRKEIYQLSREQHLTNKEIAQKLSISEKTVESQLTKALRYIKEKLSSDKGLALLLFYLLS